MTAFPDLKRADIPQLSTEQMIEVDRAMIDDYGIALIQMMENAGRNLANLARQKFLHNKPQGKSVSILAGRGGNGGGAMVAARHLANWGSTVSVILSKDPQDFEGIPAQQLSILRNMGIRISTIDTQPDTPGDLVIDGIIGYSLSGAPRGTAARMIRWTHQQPAPVLALDVPSGLDASSGKAFTPSINAAATLTLALPKRGLGHPQIGELYLADISVPPDLYLRFLDIEVGPIFASGTIQKLV